MSINWKWENKIGTWTEDCYGEQKTFNIYKCNGLAIVLEEWKNNKKQDVYQVHTFFVDEKHLKNMLGLSKEYGKENLLYNLRKISIIQCKEANIIIKNLLKAEWKTDILIEIINLPF